MLFGIFFLVSTRFEFQMLISNNAQNKRKKLLHIGHPHFLVLLCWICIEKYNQIRIPFNIFVQYNEPVSQQET